MSELRKRMIRDMELRNFSPATQRGYLRAVAGLAEYYHRSPDRISTEEIQDYVVYLLSERKVAVGTCHAIITALRFFYIVTLEQNGASVAIPQVKRVTRLPEILGPEQLFAAPSSAALLLRPSHKELATLFAFAIITPYNSTQCVEDPNHGKDEICQRPCARVGRVQNPRNQISG